LNVSGGWGQADPVQVVSVSNRDHRPAPLDSRSALHAESMSPTWRWAQM